VSASLTSPAVDPTGKSLNPTIVTLSTTIPTDQSAQGTVTVETTSPARRTAPRTTWVKPERRACSPFTRCSR
jgi:hypothetical protein